MQEEFQEKIEQRKNEDTFLGRNLGLKLLSFSCIKSQKYYNGSVRRWDSDRK